VAFARQRHTRRALPISSVGTTCNLTGLEGPLELAAHRRWVVGAQLLPPGVGPRSLVSLVGCRWARLVGLEQVQPEQRRLLGLDVDVAVLARTGGGGGAEPTAGEPPEALGVGVRRQRVAPADRGPDRSPGTAPRRAQPGVGVQRQLDVDHRRSSVARWFLTRDGSGG
jgi:hypothetical protein